MSINFAVKSRGITFLKIFGFRGTFWIHWRYFGFRSAVRQVRRKDEPTLAFSFIWNDLDHLKGRQKMKSEIVMENEEIYKLALERLKKWDRNWMLKYLLCPFFLGIFGFILISAPVSSVQNWKGTLGFIVSAVLFAGVMVALLKAFNDHEKTIRNYTYNMVRKDERKRINKDLEVLRMSKHRD